MDMSCKSPSLFLHGGNNYSSYNWVNIFYYAGKSTSYTGGIVGAVSGNSIIRNCYNSAEIESNSSYATLGGLVGLNSGSGEFSLINCYNIGSVEGGYDFGDIFGMNYSTQGGSVNNSYYLSSTDDGNGGKTAEQFASGEVAYLLQNGEVSEEEYAKLQSEAKELMRIAK